jgi:hypothetical protein
MKREMGETFPAKQSGRSWVSIQLTSLWSMMIILPSLDPRPTQETKVSKVS